MESKQYATEQPMGHWRNQKEIKKKLETNEKETQSKHNNTTIQNLWNTAKAVLRGKFTAIQAYLRKQEKSQDNLSFHLKEPEKEE